MKNELARIKWTDLDSRFNDTLWREGVWRQLEKDTLMSGIATFPTKLPLSFEAMIDVLDPFISGLKNNKHQWDALAYRVDLPSSIEIWSLDTREVARLFVLRSLQKVWLRAHYSPNNAKVVRKARKKP